MKSFILLFAGLVFTSFTVYTTASTIMKVYVVDENEMIIEGATVEVFKTHEDYKKEIHVVVSGKTNKKGFVEFKNLQERVYYLLVKKGDLNNHGEHVQTDTLSPVGKNRFQIMIN